MAEKTTGYQLLKNENERLTTENLQLSQRVKDLWAQSEAKEKEVQRYGKEAEALKTKLEALNAQSRDSLVKKNFEQERLQKLETENEDLRIQIGYKNGQIESLSVFKFDFGELEKKFSELKSEKESLETNFKILEENSILDKQRFEVLKEIEKDLIEQISGLKKKVVEFNEFKTVQDKAAKEKETVLNSLNVELDKLKNENAIYKEAQSKESRKMYAFKTVVIFLAVLANYFLLGKKFMNLTGESDWQTYLISYGSVLIFDLTVILLTILNKSKEALYFAIGVFILTFLQIAKPFHGLGLDVDFYGFNLQYFERFVSGGIYSVFFAFLPYFLSKITKE